jgi:hypothetical protein
MNVLEVGRIKPTANGRGLEFDKAECCEICHRTGKAGGFGDAQSVSKCNSTSHREVDGVTHCMLRLALKVQSGLHPAKRALQSILTKGIPKTAMV